MKQQRQGTYRNCKTCSKSFYVYPSAAKHDAHLYCSYQCWLNDPERPQKFRKGEKVTRICECCGKEYERLKSEKKCQRFCSHECAYASRKGPQHPNYNPESKVKRVCPVCKKTFERPRSWEPSKTYYCSRECQAIDRSVLYSGENHPNWQGGRSRGERDYGPNWGAMRRKARNRDGYKCTNCGKAEVENGKHLDVHHIKPFAEFDGDWRAANSLSNLRSLCNRCHTAIEPRPHRKEHNDDRTQDSTTVSA